MKTQDWFKTGAPLVLAVCLVGLNTVPASATSIDLYNNIPNGVLSVTPPGGIPTDCGGATNCPSSDSPGGPETSSYASSANGATSFGSYIKPTIGSAGTATVVLSNYATQAVYDPSNLSPDGYIASLELTLFDVSTLTPTGTAPGAAYDLTGVTGTNFFNSAAPIGWRPPADGGGTPGDCLGTNSDTTIIGGQRTCGQLNFVSFDLGGFQLTSDMVWEVSILGSNSPGTPTNSLNWAVTDLSSNYTETANPNALINYVNGAANSNLGPFQGELQVTSAVPEPGTLGLIGFGLVALGLVSRKKARA